jgi:hypothetical protein
MTDVEFFFDPSCPWTWVTSRWLVTVAPARQLAVTWRPWSLPMKHEGQVLPADLPEVWRARIMAGQAFAVPALRVLEAAGAREGNPARGRLYTELGRRFHGEGDVTGGEASAPQDPRALIEEALAAARLPPVLALAAADESWDDPIRDTMDEIRRTVGDEVGVPIIAIGATGDGKGRLAMAGPIMAEVPPDDRARALWDAVATVVGEATVFELKRHRTAKPQLPVLDADGGRA